MKNFQNKTKIVKVSKIIRAILFIGLVFLAIGILSSLFLIFVPFVLSKYIPQLDSIVFFRTFVIFIFCFIINLNFFRFFDRLKNGHLFDSQTIKNLKSAGKWWLGLWLFSMVSLIINHRIDPSVTISIDGITDLGDLFAGLFIIFIAWLFHEAQELQEEQELTV